MQIVFRVDASVRIGTGHVMRCLNLANEFSARECECLFICRSMEGNLLDRIRTEGYPTLPLPRDIDVEEDSDLYGERWLGASQDEDAAQTMAALSQVPGNVDWLVIDHYGIDHSWESTVRPSVDKIMVIDDLANREHHADILIDQNWYGNATEHRYSGLLANDCVQLFGPGFAMLPSVYRRKREQLGPRRKDIERVLVFFGGSDNDHLTTKTIRALCDPRLRHLVVDVVLGANHAAQEEVEAEARSRGDVAVMTSLPDLSDLMASADLMIGAGGITNWERCCLGVPSIILSTAENQVEVNEALADSGLINYMGRAETVSSDDIADMIARCLEDTEGLSAQSRDMMQLVSGDGVTKIADRMLLE